MIILHLNSVIQRRQETARMKWRLDYGVEDTEYEVIIKFSSFYFIIYLGHHETNTRYFLPPWVPQAECAPLFCIPTVLCSSRDLPFIILHCNYLLMDPFSQLDKASLGKNLYCVPFVFLAWIGFEHSKGSINICEMKQTQNFTSPGQLWVSVQHPNQRILCLLLPTVWTPPTIWGPLMALPLAGALCLALEAFFLGDQPLNHAPPSPTWIQPQPTHLWHQDVALYLILYGALLFSSACWRRQWPLSSFFCLLLQCGP